LPDTTLIVDAGIGRVSHACQVIELGYDGILLNSAVALSKNPPKFAESIYNGVNSAIESIKAGPISVSKKPIASTTSKGIAFRK